MAVNIEGRLSAAMVAAGGGAMAAGERPVAKSAESAKMAIRRLANHSFGPA